MFGSDPSPLYEGVWKIEDVSVVGDNQILVNFKTAFFESEEEATDPEERQPYDYGPAGKSIQSVKLDGNRLPSINEFNGGNRHKIYEVLTEELDLEVREETDS